MDEENAAAKSYTPRKNFYTMAQISKWVRPGAQRIRVSGSASPFSPLLAFKHADLGQITIVGINTSAQRRDAEWHTRVVAGCDAP